MEQDTVTPASPKREGSGETLCASGKPRGFPRSRGFAAGPEGYAPGRETAESAAWFRAKLDELHIGQSALARLMLAHGDDRQFATTLRSLSRMASGDARVSGETRALLGVLAESAMRERQVDHLTQVKTGSAAYRTDTSDRTTKPRRSSR